MVITYCLKLWVELDPWTTTSLQGLQEINKTFDLSPSWYVEGWQHQGGTTGLTGDSQNEANSYLNYAINNTYLVLRN
jgi:phycocyanin alpha chain